MEDRINAKTYQIEKECFVGVKLSEISRQNELKEFKEQIEVEIQNCKNLSLENIEIEKEKILEKSFTDKTLEKQMQQD